MQCNDKLKELLICHGLVKLLSHFGLHYKAFNDKGWLRTP
jgi:hypothetical protein